ncbi:DegT/DnrJ/EryC1/StrS family aminotransferase [Litoreibacter roseus]|uniref:Aminotransferase DegT n=1 Tax=Litoreibacter roseus TaxID=2601869 RepID=A0A6N6JJA9_9RHOB|nr:aminotransferase class I/II-fold pyridoxal phosphate-dependent enzyme [Litoreibacter roseus]GFE65910.1 aminotransferase DegT [Litoreibacter roseus]
MRDFSVEAPDLYSAEPIPASAQAAIEALLESGDLFRYTTPETSPAALLERAFAEKLGARFALAVSSCSAALFLSLKALNLRSGARVLIPAFTFAAVPSAIVHAGCVPVLVEVDSTYRVDLADLEEKAITADAILISHMRGHTSDMDAILKIAHTNEVPMIEDAAHSLGTTWNGRNIGTLGKIGCFSFQSYKMLNAGEGGMLITDDPELIARAVIMSGAYEHNWKSHAIVRNAAEPWQNKLPLYNMRMQNLSACVVRPQLDMLDQRVVQGRANHDQAAKRLQDSGYFTVPASLPLEQRAPDSIQFNLVDFSEDQARSFMVNAKENGITASVFGLSTDNARAFWNWQFIDDIPELPKTRAMLSKACDVRLPARLDRAEVDYVADVLIDAARRVKG